MSDQSAFPDSTRMDRGSGLSANSMFGRKVLTLMLLFAAALLLTGRLGEYTPTDAETPGMVVPNCTYTAIGDISSCGGD